MNWGHTRSIAALALSLISGRPGIAQDTPGAPSFPLDTFESPPRGWKFVGGEEFPGAKGSLNLDPSRAHDGKSSYRLDADFSGGGAYVGSWKEIDPKALPEVEALRLWVETRNLSKLGVRLVDRTGQCHQKTIDLPAGEGWREVVLKPREIAGGEHWGGANDGEWHGSPKGLGLNIGRDSVGGGEKKASLWIDDLSVVGLAPGNPLLRACSIDPPSCRPGYGARIRYSWDAEPLGSNCNVFVHFIDPRRGMAFQADHEPGVSTTRWSGRVEYGKTFTVPGEIKPGRYDVVVGIWDPRPSEVGGGNRPFRVGPGLTPLPGNACRVGSIEVSNDAPLPKLPPPSLDLSSYKPTFDEDFAGPLSISSKGPGTRWIAHTPYFGDFGDAYFGDPEKDSPFSIEDGLLRIEARKVGDRWRSGLICSVDPEGRGFSQKFGYFEMRARLPKGLGTWPAFWLMGVPQLVQPRDKKTIPQIEVDVVEQYGVGPNSLHTTVHLWGPGDFHWAEGDTSIVPGMTDDFHTYGVSVEDDFITFYFDGVELRRDKTPKDAKVPLYLMVDLALGGGWPIDKTPNPSVMLVDYVRAYTKK